MRSLVDWSAGYPSLSYVWTAVVFGAVGVSESAARLGQLLWYLLLVVSVYLCIRSRTGRTVALLFDGHELRPRDNVREAVSHMLRLKDRFPGSPDVPVTPPPDLVLVFCEARDRQGVHVAVEHATGTS